MLEPIRKTSSHTTYQGTLVQRCLSFSATVDWHRPKDLNEIGVCKLISIACASLTPLKKKKRRSAGREWFNEPSPKILASNKKAGHPSLLSRSILTHFYNNNVISHKPTYFQYEHHLLPFIKLDLLMLNKNAISFVKHQLWHTYNQDNFLLTVTEQTKSEI